MYSWSRLPRTPSSSFFPLFPKRLFSGAWLSWLERRLCKPDVRGSNPLVSNKRRRTRRVFFDTTREGKTNKKRRKKAFRGSASLERAEGAIWPSESRPEADALGPSGEEGRGRPRKSRGRSERPLIPGFPNGATRRKRFRHPNA